MLTAVFYLFVACSCFLQEFSLLDPILRATAIATSSSSSSSAAPPSALPSTSLQHHPEQQLHSPSDLDHAASQPSSDSRPSCETNGFVGVTGGVAAGSGVNGPINHDHHEDTNGYHHSKANGYPPDPSTKDKKKEEGEEGKNEGFAIVGRQGSKGTGGGKVGESEGGEEHRGADLAVKNTVNGEWGTGKDEGQGQRQARSARLPGPCAACGREAKRTCKICAEVGIVQ